MNGFSRLHGALALLAICVATLPGCIQFGFSQKEIDDAKIQFGIGGNTDGGTSGDDDDSVNIDGATGKVCDRDEDCGSGFECAAIGGGEKRCRALNDDGVSLDDAGTTSGASDTAGTDGATDSGSETTDGDDTTTPTDCAPPSCEAVGRVCGSLTSECGTAIECDLGDACAPETRSCLAVGAHSVEITKGQCSGDGKTCPTVNTGTIPCTFTCVAGDCATPQLEDNVTPNGGTRPSARKYASLAYDGGTALYLVGGELQAGGLTDEIWRYAGGSWNLSSKKLPQARYRMSALTMPGNAVLLVGGALNTNPQSAADYAADAWFMVNETVTAVGASATHTARTGIALTYRNSANLVYSFGGFDGTYHNDLWSSPDGDTWTQVTPTGTPPAARADAHLFVYEDRIYVSGGRNGATAYDDTWVYNPANNAWTELSVPVPPRVFGGRALFVPEWDRVVVAGAMTGAGNAEEPFNSLLVWSESGWAWFDLPNSLALRGAGVDLLPDGSASGTLDALYYVGGYENSGAVTNRIARVSY
jgi:hypothetical protein